MYTLEQQRERQQFTAVLKNLPPNLKAVNLGQIFSTTSASSIGLPRYVGSYRSKLWAYFAFRSQVQMDAAMELSCSLKGNKLSWVFPEDVKNLCVRCASDKHKTKDCNTFEDRGRKSIPKSIQNNYDRYKPVGYVKPPVKSASNKKSSSQTRSQSRSNSKARTENKQPS